MNKFRGLLIVAVVVVAMLMAGTALAACSDEDTGEAATSPSADVVAAVQADDQLTKFAEAIVGVGLDGKGPYTVFAATDDALTEAGVTLSADAVKAAVIEGEELDEATLAEGNSTDSMLEDNKIVTYTGSDGSLYVNNMKVTGGPLSAGNGVVYIVDGVIQPKE